MTRNGQHENGHGHVTETPDVSHIKNVDVTHERSDVDVGALLKFVGALTVMTGFVAVLMWGLFVFFQSTESKKDRERPPGPMALSEQERLPPEPRLQSARGFGFKTADGQWVSLEKREPQAEYRELRQQWDRELNCSGEDAKATQHATPNESGAQHATPPHGSSEPGSGAAPASHAAPCVSINQAMKTLLEKGLPSRKEGSFASEPAMPTAASSGRTAPQ